MKILKAKPTDFELIAPLFDQYRQFYKQTSNIEGAKEFLKFRISREESVIFYASDEQLALGFVQLYPSFSSISMRRLWVLNDLFVRPDSRKGSVGRHLLRKAVEFARETNAKGLTLKTALDNVPAQRLYESEGWKRDDRFFCYDLTAD